MSYWPLAQRSSASIVAPSVERLTRRPQLQTRAAVVESTPDVTVRFRDRPGRYLPRDNGFRDGIVSHFKRPVKCDPVDWLRTFGKVYLDGVENQENFLEAYRAACSRRLPDGEID